MKKFIILVLIIGIFLMVGCLDNYIPIEEYNNEVALYESQLEEANSKTEAKDVEILELKEEVNTLENDLELSNEETEKYKYLLANLNELLSNVYYVYQKKSDGSSSWGTGFSIEYQGNYYLITAGHIVDGEYGKFTNLGFKANFSDEWIFPKLLVYNNDYLNRNDYAIFYSDKIDSGLKLDVNNTEPDYRLGINRLIQENNNWGEEGSCGSPIIDLDGEVIGVHVGYLTDIDLIIRAIDNLE